MSKPIALPAVLALALCGAAQGQSITWVEEGGKTGGSLKLPRLASDYIESFLVVGNQQSTGPLGYLTGTTYDCIFAYAICWGSAGHDNKGANPSVALTVMTDAQNTKLDTAVEVHEGTNASLFFHTGTNLYPCLARSIGTAAHNTTAAISPACRSIRFHWTTFRDLPQRWSKSRRPNTKSRQWYGGIGALVSRGHT